MTHWFDQRMIGGKDYGKGISSSSLKEKIRKNYAKLKKKADSHLPLNAKTKG